MAATTKIRAMHVWIGIIAFCVFITTSSAQEAECTIPKQFQGDWFSIERGEDVDTITTDYSLENRFYKGVCMEIRHHNDSIDANGNFDSEINFFDGISNCYKCFYMIYRTLNIVQYKQSDCKTPTNGNNPGIDTVCGDIKPNTDTNTFFRKTLATVNCKNTFEGVYQFTYEWNQGGAGICDADKSQIVACQEPGSPYVDNQVFNMNFGYCPDVSTSTNEQFKFQCMGTWKDDNGDIWSAVADLGEEVYRERFRCLLTREDQEEENNMKRYTMSWFAQCNTLKTPYEGDMRLRLEPVIGDFQFTYSQPTCNFPVNYAGHWYHTGELDVDVDINMTHIYFNTKFDQYRYKESYFICMMNSGTRYMAVAITVGKCEIDYVCFDMLPRHHSVIRWRMGKPYRLTEIEMAKPDFKVYMFRQACTWSSFTVDREDIAWNYKTFLLNPPVPIPCPIRGRYFFTQKGPETELFRTRIRGITERPRNMVDCRQYVTEIKSCDENPTKLLVDAEYCETLDHTGSPVSEYDMADWEMTCVGHWDEDWNNYMITYDPEDPTSAFRCWNYEREDWRHIVMSRSTGAACAPTQAARSHDPLEGSSLALAMEESERLYDDCAMQFVDGDPWKSPLVSVQSWDDGSGATYIQSSVLVLLSALLMCLVTQRQ